MNQLKRNPAFLYSNLGTLPIRPIAFWIKKKIQMEIFPLEIQKDTDDSDVEVRRFFAQPGSGRVANSRRNIRRLDLALILVDRLLLFSYPRTPIGESIAL
jgi:hypothetical protein